VNNSHRLDKGSSRWIVLALAALTVVACSEKPESETNSRPPPPAATPAAGSEPALDSATFVHGGSRPALVAYLKNVRETPARKFEVEWNPDVVKIDRQAAIDSLQSVSADGAVFRFTDSAVIRELQPGRILFLWGIALRRVIVAAADGNEWVVTTSQVSFPEVFRNANIDFESPLDTHQVFAAFRPPAPVNPPPGASLQREAGFIPVAFINDASAEEAPPGGPTIIDLPNSFATSANGFDIELAYQPIDGGLHFQIEARKQQSDVHPSAPNDNPRSDIEKYAKEKRKQDADNIAHGRDKTDEQQRAEADEAARKAGKEWGKTAAAGPNAPNKALVEGLFSLGSELWDLRVRASGDIHGVSAADSVSVSNQLQIHNSALGLLKTDFHNVSGKLKLEFVARRGQETEQWIEKLKIDVPLRFNIPIIVGGLPMVFQVGFDIIVQPALTTKNDTFDASYEIPFSGNGSVGIEDGKFVVGGTLATDPHPLQKLASSIGVSAILVAVQAPRVGLGLGIFGASSVAYIDVVATATITSGGALGLVPCKQYQLVGTVSGGIDTKIAFDIPGLTDFLTNPLNEQLKKASQAASIRQKIFEKEWYRVEPDAPICHPDRQT